MAVTTLKGHVSRALDFFRRPEIYFGIGKSTNWTEDDRTPGTPDTQTVDEYNPPVPMSTDDMVQVVGYKKAESVFLVVPDEEGTLRYRDTKWRVVSQSDALDEGARWVYVSTYISYDELPTNISYRQIGCFTGLIKAEGVSEGKFSLLPEEVKDPGILEVLDNRKAIYREPDQREQLVIVIEF